ncbi:MAG: endonuclease/exonuclease/phosphatase family protein [Phycisphaerales bacterium]|nr:endonuclease/exonuclease/phosphatase family protein [Phycisphaerales bacterium]
MSSPKTWLAIVVVMSVLVPAATATGPSGPVRARVMTFNILDARSDALASGTDARLKRVAAVIQRLRPDVLLLNEIQYDAPDGHNAQAFADRYLAVSQGQGLEPLSLTAFMRASNTGVPSGLDLDRNGAVDTTPGTRTYGGDCFGYGEFPGQFAMGLLVRADWAIEAEHVRTFQNFLWRDMPGADLPPRLDAARKPIDGDLLAGEGWYTAEALAKFRLSSKSHWDVPVRMGGAGAPVIHVLASHPTPPAFDGPEGRNQRRNHDEIRLWKEHLSGAPWLTDDNGLGGGLDQRAWFVIMGDLNADPERGSSRGRAIGQLLAHPRVDGDFRPVSTIGLPRLQPQDTADFRLRVDYILPARGIRVLAGGVWRGAADSPGEGPAVPGWESGEGPSDHFPVWLDIEVPVAVEEPKGSAKP